MHNTITVDPLGRGDGISPVINMYLCLRKTGSFLYYFQLREMNNLAECIIFDILYM